MSGKKKVKKPSREPGTGRRFQQHKWFDRLEQQWQAEHASNHVSCWLTSGKCYGDHSLSLSRFFHELGQAQSRSYQGTLRSAALQLVGNHLDEHSTRVETGAYKPLERDHEEDWAHYREAGFENRSRPPDSVQVEEWGYIFYRRDRRSVCGHGVRHLDSVSFLRGLSEGP